MSWYVWIVDFSRRLTADHVCFCCSGAGRFPQILDVEDNQLTDLSSCLFLRACSELRSLNLLGNPVCSDSEQLQQLAEWLPQLQTLNGQLTAAGERLLRRLQRSPQQQLPPVPAPSARQSSLTSAAAARRAVAAAAGVDSVPPVGARRRQSIDAQSAASSVSRPSTGSGASLPASSLSSTGSGSNLPTSSPSRSTSSGGPSLPAASASSTTSSPRPTASSSSASPRLPAIDGSGGRRPAGGSADSGGGGERRATTVGQVKVNTWMAEVAAGKTQVDRHLASGCK